jgi:hypothetical protein
METFDAPVQATLARTWASSTSSPQDPATKEPVPKDAYDHATGLEKYASSFGRPDTLLRFGVVTEEDLSRAVQSCTTTGGQQNVTTLFDLVFDVTALKYIRVSRGNSVCAASLTDMRHNCRAELEGFEKGVDIFHEEWYV